jgi:GTP-binding protein
MFVDQVKVSLSAGAGGNGCMSFRRERGVPKGGPDGGHGGQGGSIYFEADESVKSLAYFRFHPINKARRGAHGQGSNKHGKRGEDLVLRVPLGTAVREVDQVQVKFDLTRHKQRCLAAAGGKGGKGNSAFATSTNQAPRIFEEGRPGEEVEYVLELKLIADVGLVGFPNVGKSTLISKVSAAKPVIADYPFTTLEPNLGVVDVGEFQSFVMADIPGLIEGAHQGQGLGIRFLKHVERTQVLVHLVDVSPYTDRDPIEDYYTVMRELESFKTDLSGRPQILVANKIDLLGDDKIRLYSLRELAEQKNLPFFAVSAIKSQGIKELVNALAQQLGLKE